MRFIYPFIAFVLFLFFPAIVKSQANFMEGYVVEHSGDTTHGFIDYKNWPFNPGRIIFKTNLQAEGIVYKPLDIGEFAVNNESYVSAIVETEMSTKTGASSLDHDPVLDIQTDTVFLEAIVKGPKSLYRYKNFEDIENLYIKTEGKYNLLIYKRYIKEVDNKGTIVENKTYIGQLTLYLSECKDMQSKMWGIKYSSKSLVKAFKSYYECIGQEAQYGGDTKKSIGKLGLLAGLIYTTPSFTGSYPDYMIDNDFGSSTNFTLGLSYDFILPRMHQRLSFYNAFMITSYSVSAEYHETETEINYSDYKISIGSSHLKWLPAIKYRYPLGKVFVSAKLGATGAFAVVTTNSLTIDHTFGDVVNTRVEPAIESTRGLELGLFGGIGVSYNKFALEVNYESSDGMSNLKTLYSKVSRIYFLISYQFKK